MLSQTKPRPTDLPGPGAVVGRARSLLARRVWLPRLLYELLPYFYLTAGFSALFATLYVSEWFWVLPHYLLFAAACLHLGCAIYQRRRYRDTAATTPNKLPSAAPQSSPDA